MLRSHPNYVNPCKGDDCFMSKTILDRLYADRTADSTPFEREIAVTTRCAMSHWTKTEVVEILKGALLLVEAMPVCKIEGCGRPTGGEEFCEKCTEKRVCVAQ